MPDFIPGLALSRLYYKQAVRPVIEEHFPGIPHSAALVGAGSEVLGFDSEMSIDHCWGPRLQLFLNESDYHKCSEPLRDTLSTTLPTTFLGYSTEFSLVPGDHAPVELRAEERSCRGVQLFTATGYASKYLSLDVSGEITPADWLTCPQQLLKSFTAGKIYHDEVGLQPIRDRFAYYPRDIWLYMLAAGWTRIGQEEHLMGRAGYVGDEIGSALIGARLVRDVMELCFLMERAYVPYPKWFGTAFTKLNCAAELSPYLQQALRADTWQQREEGLAGAYEILASMHNSLRITPSRPTKPDHFFDRPFRVIHLHGGFANAICERIEDPRVQELVARRIIGNIDQISDSTDLLSDADRRQKLREMY